MRLGVYSDFSYRREGDALFAELPFVLFLVGLAPYVERLVLIGRLDPTPGTLPHPVPPTVRFVGLPHYARLSDPLGALRATAGSLVRFWRALDQLDCVWLLGPHPLAVAFALMARMRGRRFALGVRQDLPRYARYRHPDRRLIQAAAGALQAAWRRLGRHSPVIAVGAELARQFAGSERVLDVWISLVSERDIAGPEVSAGRPYDGKLNVLSVGRLDAEKNPLLLADVLDRLRRDDPRWRLVVCGTGPMAGELGARLEALGHGAASELRGYVPVDGRLMELYRNSHAFLHVSWTEGMPQVLLEAFASRVPVVATAVGGVPEVAGGAALLVEPGDAQAAADQLARLAADHELRDRVVAAGLERVRAHTLESECRRVVRFLEGADHG